MLTYSGSFLGCPWPYLISIKNAIIKNTYIRNAYNGDVCIGSMSIIKYLEIYSQSF